MKSTGRFAVYVKVAVSVIAPFMVALMDESEFVL